MDNIGVTLELKQKQMPVVFRANADQSTIINGLLECPDEFLNALRVCDHVQLIVYSPSEARLAESRDTLQNFLEVMSVKNDRFKVKESFMLGESIKFNRSDFFRIDVYRTVTTEVQQMTIERT